MKKVKVPPQPPALIVRLYYDTEPSVSDHGARYMHCAQCLQEWTDGLGEALDAESPKDYVRQQFAITHDGHFQLWCTRHNCNIALITLRAEYRKPGEPPATLPPCSHCAEEES